MTRLEKDYHDHRCWGMTALINLSGCHPPFIRDPKKIKSLILGLCRAIRMRPFGQALINRFGREELLGYSALQFIETSSITLHFDEAKNRAFVDIFSCKYFDYKKAERFLKKFLRAKKAKTVYYFRY